MFGPMPPPPPDWTSASAQQQSAIAMRQLEAKRMFEQQSFITSLKNQALYGGPVMTCMSACGDYGYDRVIAKQFVEPQNKPVEKTMFQEVVADVKTFVREHRGIIYFVAIALLMDHFVFQGIFKDRLKTMAGKIVGKIEAKLDAAQ